jgi:ADP-ribose pyrophosphatase YjhB (NUDIX family)
LRPAIDHAVGRLRRSPKAIIRLVNLPNTFCSRCGSRYGDTTAYPRRCASCSTETWVNPIPVAVLLAPVRTADGEGLLVVRRTIPPQIGMLCLLGGFVEAHETWQEAGAREAREEAGVAVAAADVAPFWFASSAPKPDRILLFGTIPPRDVAELPPFTPSNESSERGLIFGPGGIDDVIAFPLHIAAARRYFADRGIARSHDFLAT